MDSELGAWLRQQREDRGWTKTETARRLAQAAREADDTAIPELIGMLHNIHRWEREGGVSERYRLYYCRAFGVHPSQFGPRGDGDPVDPILPGLPVAATSADAPAVLVPAQRPVVPDLAGQHLPISAAVAYRGVQQPGLGRFTAEREVLMAAHEGSDHAEEYEQHGIGEATAEQLRADVIRLSRLSDTGSPLPAFLDMRRVRDRVYRLLDRRLWPREQTDLHFLLGCLNGLMGITANRLGYPDAAEELIRAGYASAAAIDHRPLQAQLRQQLSSVLYLRGRISESDELAVTGLEYLSQGPEAAHLYLNHARAAATLGDTDAARQAVSRAHEAREHDYSDELLDIGGEFAVSLATHHALAGAALAETEGAEQDAAAELERSVRLYDQGPGPGEQHWFGGKPLAGIDLAVVRLRSGALDAAATALEPVLALPAEQRISDLASRLALVRRELTAPVFRGSPHARDLGNQIEEFGREAVIAGLHSLSG
jgi:tetratricopeptide (TPR) repeat protein